MEHDITISEIHLNQCNQYYMYQGKLHIASDHRGYHLKERLVRFIENELNLEIADIGPHEYDETDDYVDYTIPLTREIIKTNGRGILLCKNGIGVCIAANKAHGIHAGIGYNISVAESMMLDDNTNVLCLAATQLSEDHAMAIVKKWLETEFSGAERHVRRLGKIDNIEK